MKLESESGNRPNKYKPLRRVYCSLRTSQRIANFCVTNGYDYWAYSSDNPRFKRYILVEEKVAILIVGEFPKARLRTMEDAPFADNQETP